MYLKRKRFVIRNWLMQLWGLASPKSAGWAGRLETQERRAGVQRQCWRIFSYPEKAGLFVLFRPSTDWMRPTHTTEDNLLYSESTNLNVNLIQKTPSQEHPK